jgi:hypothetical protein
MFTIDGAKHMPFHWNLYRYVILFDNLALTVPEGNKSLDQYVFKKALCLSTELIFKAVRHFGIF